MKESIKNQVITRGNIRNRLYVYLDPFEKWSIQELAKIKGVSASGYVHNLIIEDLKKYPTLKLEGRKEQKK